MYTLDKHVSWVENEFEVVIINTNTQKCVILKGTGLDIWKKILEKYDIDEMAVLFHQKYPESSFETIRSDCKDCIDELLNQGFIY